jgi:hypothetical protein
LFSFEFDFLRDFPVDFRDFAVDEVDELSAAAADFLRFLIQFLS